MANVIADAAVRIGADTSGFVSGLEKDVKGAVGRVSSGIGGILKAGLSLAGIGAAAGLVEFGRESVKAFSDAQEAEQKFDFAFSKFPKLADVSKESLKALAEQLSEHTKFSRLDVLATESQLAAFNLTGKQIKQLVPLVADFAARTGRDLPSAAQTLGKALLGNTRALKEVGINLKIGTKGTNDLGKAQKELSKAQEKLSQLEERLGAKRKISLADTVALQRAEQALSDARDSGNADKVARAEQNLALVQDRIQRSTNLSIAQQQELTNAQQAVADAQNKVNAATGKGAAGLSDYDKIMGALRDKVGGFAKDQANTLAGKMAILRNRFEEVRIKIGAFLVNALTPVVKFIADKAIPFIGKLSGPISDVSKVLFAAAKTAIPAFFSAFNSPGGDKANSRLTKMRDDSITLSDVLQSFASVMQNDVNPALSSLGDVINRDIIPNVKLTIDIFRGAGVQADHFVRDAIGGFEAFGRFIDGFVERFRLSFQGIGDVLHGLFDIVRSIVSGAIAVLGGLMRFIAGVFTGNIRAALHGLGGIFSGLARIIAGSIGGAIRVFIGIAESIVGVFTGIIGKVFHAGEDIARGFFDGIVRTIGRLASHLPGILKDRIPEPIRKFFRIQSPSKLMFAIGSDIGRGLNLGLLAELNKLSVHADLRRLTDQFGTISATPDGALAMRSAPIVGEMHITTGQTNEAVLANEIAFRLEQEARR